MRWMFFLDKGFVMLEDVTFASFPNLTVLKLSASFESLQVLALDLRGLKHLKSLKLELNWTMRSQNLISLVGLGSLLKLGFLRWSNISTDSPCIDEIVRLTNLRVVDLDKCGRLPDVSNLILLQVASFRHNDLMETITGLSSKHTNLQYLDLSWCKKLQRCEGVGELVALQELRLNCCSMLKEVPNLQKLKLLRKLHVGWCKLLAALPGLGHLVNLLELHAIQCHSLTELPDLCNLKNVRILNLQWCKLIKSLPSLEELVSLQSLNILGCENLTQLPEMHKLSNLQTLEWDPSYLQQSFAGYKRDSTSHRSLLVRVDEGHIVGPDLRKLTKLEKLHIGWQGHEISCLAELVMLKFAIVHNCKGVRVLPNLDRLSKLRRLEFWGCEFEDMSGLSHLTSLKELKIRECNKVQALPDLRELATLKELRVEHCAHLRDVRGVLWLRNLELLHACSHPWLHESLGPILHWLTSLRFLYVSNCGFLHLQGLAVCTHLCTLICSGCPIKELPDLANFPNIFWLDVHDCVNLTKLTCTGPSSPIFMHLDVHGCRKLQVLPDLTNSRSMKMLNVAKSGVVMSAQLIQDMEIRWSSFHLIVE